MNILAIDYGRRRIGFALRAGIQVIELPHQTWKKDFELHALLTKIIEDYDVEQVVLGIPPYGPVREEIQELGRWISQHVSVVLHNETFSTVQAEHELTSVAMPAKKQKKYRDSVAARLILEDFLQTL